MISSSVITQITKRIYGDSRVYLSIDSVPIDEPDHGLYPIEFLNSIEVSGLPRHRLELKKGIIVILLRNLNTSRGLINGTRLSVNEMFNHSLKCTILTGTYINETVLIPKITLCPSQATLPIKIQRLQFPIAIAFCMTINKSQGQTLNKVALYLPAPVFTHGQLYVALSRARSFGGSKVFIEEGPNQKHYPDGTFSTRNIVYREVLQ